MLTEIGSSHESAYQTIICGRWRTVRSGKMRSRPVRRLSPLLAVAYSFPIVNGSKLPVEQNIYSALRVSRADAVNRNRESCSGHVIDAGVLRVRCQQHLVQQ